MQTPNSPSKDRLLLSPRRKLGPAQAHGTEREAPSVLAAGPGHTECPGCAVLMTAPPGGFHPARRG